MHASPDALHPKGGVLDEHRQHTGGPPRPTSRPPGTDLAGGGCSGDWHWHKSVDQVVTTEAREAIESTT